MKQFSRHALNNFAKKIAGNFAKKIVIKKSLGFLAGGGIMGWVGKKLFKKAYKEVKPVVMEGGRRGEKAIDKLEGQKSEDKWAKFEVID